MTIGPLIMAVGALMLLLVADDFDLLVAGAARDDRDGSRPLAHRGAADRGDPGGDRREPLGIASAVNNAISRVAGLLVVAMLSTIVGGTLDLDGFHNAAWVTAALLVVGGVVSWIGIRRNPAEPAPADVAASGAPQ